MAKPKVPPSRRQDVAAILNDWLRQPPFNGNQSAMAIAAGIDGTRLNRLLNAKEGVGFNLEECKQIAAACGADPVPLLEAAGYLIGSEQPSVPPRLVAMLSQWQPWELELLSDELAELRARYQRVASLVASGKAVAATAERSPGPGAAYTAYPGLDARLSGV